MICVNFHKVGMQGTGVGIITVDDHFKVFERAQNHLNQAAMLVLWCIKSISMSMLGCTDMHVC